MKLHVGVFFGGVSPEHEVSVISSLQAAAALDRSRYEPVPVYLAKDGTWYTGDTWMLDPDVYKDLGAVRDRATRVTLDPGPHGTLDLVAVRTSTWSFGAPRRWALDVAFLGFHGGEGENGAMQGLCETFNVPYTGSPVFGSALGMDKALSKRLCRDAGVPIVDFVAFRESEWAYQEEDWLNRCEEALGYPVIVKPARLGSSIGIARADDRAELDAAIEEALRYDAKVVVEHGVERLREVNCSVLGDPDEAVASVLEEPVRTEGEELLTFEEKYMRGGEGGTKEAPVRRGTKVRSGAGGETAEGMASLDRLIPARLAPARADEIRDLAVRVFQLFECAGVARIDFMIDEATEQVYFNEINTIPGSFSFYLWDPRGVPDEALPHERLPFPELTHRMVEIARARHRAKNGRVRSYDVNLLSARSLSGLKGAK